MTIRFRVTIGRELDKHPRTGMSFGVAGTITPLADLWTDEGLHARQPEDRAMIGLDGTVYLSSYLDLADTHWFGVSCVACSRVQSISVPTAIRLAGTGATFGELQRRLRCADCNAPLSLVVCSDSRPAATRDRDGLRAETLGR